MNLAILLARSLPWLTSNSLPPRVALETQEKFERSNQTTVTPRNLMPKSLEKTGAEIEYFRLEPRYWEPISRFRPFFGYDAPLITQRTRKVHELYPQF
jgi:hypothetical protein